MAYNQQLPPQVAGEIPEHDKGGPVKLTSALIADHMEVRLLLDNAGWVCMNEFCLPLAYGIGLRQLKHSYE